MLSDLVSRYSPWQRYQTQQRILEAPRLRPYANLIPEPLESGCAMLCLCHPKAGIQIAGMPTTGPLTSPFEPSYKCLRFAGPRQKSRSRLHSRRGPFEGSPAKNRAPPGLLQRLVDPKLYEHYIYEAHHPWSPRVREHPRGKMAVAGW